MKKANIVNLFTILVVVLTGLQGVIPAMPLNSPQAITIISAVILFIVSGLTAWKQALSNEINNAAVLPTIIVAFVATLAGALDLLKVIPMSESIAQWMRFGITTVTLVINLISKAIWPTPQTKSIL